MRPSVAALPRSDVLYRGVGEGRQPKSEPLETAEWHTAKQTEIVARTGRKGSPVRKLGEARASRLAVIARTPAGSGWEAQSKVRALTALVELGEASPLSEHELRGLLEDVADSPPEGARGAQARLAALKALERLDALADDDEEAAKVRRLFDPSRDPDSLVEPGDPFWPSDAPPAFKALYSHETVAMRRRWFENLVSLGMIARGR
jgi:hypothetical protein